MKNFFGGNKPSDYHMNEIVKAFIVAEGFLWSGFNFVYPLLSVFVVQDIVGGSIEIAATAVSVYMIARVIFELIIGKVLIDSNDTKKITLSIIGVTLVALGFLGFSIVNSVLMVYVLKAVIGMGLGIASPAKYSLFSQHLNKKRASNEWSIYDAVSFIGMALSAALGGFIAQKYGFSILFIISGVFILLGIVPYFLLFKLEESKN